MTVIAWDGRTLAADRRSTTSCGAIAEVTKIHRINGVLVATSGNASVGRELLAWWQGGCDRKDFPDAAREDNATLVTIINKGEVMVYTTGPDPVRFENAHMAWGCGRDYARAAMQFGKTAREAVAVACELNAFCGNGIDAIGFE